MNEDQASEVAFHIGSIFPTVNPAMVKATKQELRVGVYDAAAVTEWANRRRAETSAFSLEELRRQFIADQPQRIRPPELPDHRTQAFRNQTQENQSIYQNDAANRKRFDEFFENCTDEDLAELKAEVLVNMPVEVQRMVVDKDPRKSMFLRVKIYDHMKRSTKIAARK